MHLASGTSGYGRAGGSVAYHVVHSVSLKMIYYLLYTYYVLPTSCYLLPTIYYDDDDNDGDDDYIYC